MTSNIFKVLHTPLCTAGSQPSLSLQLTNPACYIRREIQVLICTIYYFLCMLYVLFIKSSDEEIPQCLLALMDHHSETGLQNSFYSG